MNRKTIITLMLLALTMLTVKAQFVTGNSLYVKIGTVFSVDSLVFIPTEDMNLGLNNYSLKVNHTAVPGNPNASIAKHYVFNIPVNFEGNLGVIYSPSQLNGNTESLLELANSLSDESAFVTMTGCARDLGIHKVSKDVSGLDIRMLTLVNGQSALPVTLVAFEAQKEEAGVALTWKTTAETNSDFFEIQKSRDAKKWEPLGRVNSAGDSKQEMSYRFTDSNPNAGMNYYRLKMVDRDGTFALSRVREVPWTGNALRIYPNPTADRLDVDVKDWAKVEKVSVINAGGVVVSERGADKFLQLKGMRPGTYILRIQYRDGSSERVQFVKY